MSRRLISIAKAAPKRLASAYQIRIDSEGFTILELLITVSVGLLLTASAATVITTHIRTSATAEIAQRVRDDANRLNYFIQTEVSEASSVGISQTTLGCPTTGGVTISLFTLNIPSNTGIAGDSSNLSRAHYYLTPEGNLHRCGPPIQQNGSLNHGLSPVDSLLTSNVNFNIGITCLAAVTDVRQVVYEVTFNDAPNGYQPECVIARAKSYIVRDPTDAS